MKKNYSWIIYRKGWKLDQGTALILFPKKGVLMCKLTILNVLIYKLFCINSK